MSSARMPLSFPNSTKTIFPTLAFQVVEEDLCSVKALTYNKQVHLTGVNYVGGGLGSGNAHCRNFALNVADFKYSEHMTLESP